MSKSPSACFTHPLNTSFAGDCAILQNHALTCNIQSGASSFLKIPVYKIGDETAGFNSGVTDIGIGLFLVISSDGIYIGIFESIETAENCYATALTMEVALRRR